MASYKPKSLDELNNMYGKEISAQKAIAKGSSKISEQKESKFLTQESKTDFLNNDTNFEKEIFDVTTAVDEFIKKYPTPQKNAESGTVRHSHLRPASQNIPTAVPKAKIRAAGEGGISSLMSDYAKIMSDQDDEDDKLYKKNSKRRKKNKKKQLSVDKEPQIQDEPSAQPEEVSEPSEPKITQEQQEQQEFEDNYENAYSQSEDFKDEEEISADDLYYDDEEVNDTTPVKKNGSRIILRIIFSIFFVLSLLLTMAVASVNTVLNVNTGKTVFGQYSFFTSSHDFEEAGVLKDELIVCKKAETVSTSDKVVFVDYDAGIFSFGVCTKVPTEVNGNRTYTVSGNDIKPENLLGEIRKTVPKLGKIVSMIMNNFIVLLCALGIISVLFLIIVVFGLKNKGSLLQPKEPEDDLQDFEKKEPEEDNKTDENIFNDLDE